VRAEAVKFLLKAIEAGHHIDHQVPASRRESAAKELALAA
jgi:hypothetical protein